MAKKSLEVADFFLENSDDLAVMAALGPAGWAAATVTVGYGMTKIFITDDMVESAEVK